MKRIIHALSTRKCRGNCGSPEFHTAHLTWLGRLRYTGGVR